MQQPFLAFAALLAGLSLAHAQPADARNRGINRDLIVDPFGNLGTGMVRTSPHSVRAAPARMADAFVSVTTLAAPPEVRKAYKKAAREMGKEKPNLYRAAGELEQAVTLYPAFAAGWYFLGGVRLVLNDAEAARRAFKSALAADPKFPYPYLPLAILELRARRYAEAAQLAESVLEFDHGLVEAQYYSALANNMLGRYDKARHSIQEIVDGGNDRRYPGVHAMLAVIFTKESDFRSAASEYRRFLELDPDSPVAASAREFLARWLATEEVR